MIKIENTLFVIYSKVITAQLLRDVPGRTKPTTILNLARLNADIDAVCTFLFQNRTYFLNSPCFWSVD